MPNTPTGFAADGYTPAQSWPDSVEPSQFSLQLVPNSTAAASPFTGYVQAEGMAGSRWQLSASFSNIDVDQMRAARAVVSKLRGCSGRFYFLAEPGKGFIAPQPPENNPAGKVFAGPRHQAVAPSLLLTKGWMLPSGTRVARSGDYISLDDAKGWRHLFLVLDDVHVVGTGSASFIVAPDPAELSIPEDAALHYGGNASGVFYLADDEQGQITETPGAIGSLSISALEFICPNLS